MQISISIPSSEETNRSMKLMFDSLLVQYRSLAGRAEAKAHTITDLEDKLGKLELEKLQLLATIAKEKQYIDEYVKQIETDHSILKQLAATIKSAGGTVQPDWEHMEI